jgi:hypothetical protein
MEVAILVSVISNFSLLARISLSAGISYPGLSARISLYPRRRAWSTQLVSITQHKFFPIWYVITVWSDFIFFRFRSFSLSSGFFFGPQHSTPVFVVFVVFFLSRVFPHEHSFCFSHSARSYFFHSLFFILFYLIFHCYSSVDRRRSFEVFIIETNRGL